MATSRLNKEAETKITDSLSEVSELVNSGTSPNEAIAKTASAYGIPVGHIELMVRAFNVGRSEAQRRSGDEAHEKLAEFDLADVKSVMDIMYPSVVKSASVLSKDTSVSDAYYRPFNKVEPVKLAPLTPLTKLASALPTHRAENDTLGSTRTLSSLIEKIGSASDKLRMDSAATKDKVTYGIAKLANYFRTYGSKPFLVVKDNSERLFGKQASALLNIVLSSNRHLNKQAGTVDDLMAPADVHDEPYKSIKSCIELAQLHLNKQASSDYLKNLSKQALQAGFNNSLPEDNTGSVLDGMDKQAAGSSRPGMLDLVSRPFRESLGAMREHNMASANDEAKDWKFVADQRMQEMALKNIRSSAAFADLLANDERISSSHPEDVAFHFNEISKVMPESTVNTAIMRPLLRKRLESGMGQVDPVDVQQMIDMEKAMYGAPAERASTAISREKDAAYGRGFIDPFKLKPKKPKEPNQSPYKKYDEARAKAEAEAKAEAKDIRDRNRALDDRDAKWEREDELAARNSKKEPDRGPGPKPAPPKPAPPKPAPTKKPVDPAQAHADALARTRAQKVQKDQEDSAAKARQSAQAAEDASRKRQTGKYDAFSTKDVKPPNYSDMEEYKGP